MAKAIDDSTSNTIMSYQSDNDVTCIRCNDSISDICCDRHLEYYCEYCCEEVIQQEREEYYERFNDLD